MRDGEKAMLRKRLMEAEKAVEESWLCPLCGGRMGLEEDYQDTCGASASYDVVFSDCVLVLKRVIVLRPDEDPHEAFEEFDELNAGKWRWRAEKAAVTESTGKGAEE